MSRKAIVILRKKLRKEEKRLKTSTQVRFNCWLCIIKSVWLRRRDFRGGGGLLKTELFSLATPKAGWSREGSWIDLLPNTHPLPLTLIYPSSFFPCFDRKLSDLRQTGHFTFDSSLGHSKAWQGKCCNRGSKGSRVEAFRAWDGT